MRREQLAEALFEQFGHNVAYVIDGNKRQNSTTIGYHVGSKDTYPNNMGTILAACEHLLQVHLVEGVRALKSEAITKDNKVNLHLVSSSLIEEVVLCYYSLGGYETPEQFALDLCGLLGPGYTVRAGRGIQKLAGVQVIDAQFIIGGQVVNIELEGEKQPHKITL